MKIAIIGCGYVGSALAIKLKKDGHSVTVTTRSKEKFSNLQLISDHVCLIQGNDLPAMKNLLLNQDAIVISVAADDQDSYKSTYQETAEIVSKACLDMPNLKQIVYTGSTSVYGDHQGRAVDENTPTEAQNVTSKILLATENILLGLSSIDLDRKVCVLRLGEIYGPGRRISDRLRQMKDRALPGDGSSITNLSPLDDIVGGIEFALKNRLDGVYNLCNDVHISRKELYARICEEEGLEEVKWDPNRVSLHSGNKLVSNAKIKAAGYKQMGGQAVSAWF